MKKGLAFLLLLVMSTSLQANELSWLTDYGDALNLARTTARPLLLVISHDDRSPAATDRLSPGRATHPSHDLLNAYVLCRIDANSNYGKRVADAFRVTEFPHSVIIDKTTSTVLYSKAGRETDEAWKETLTRYQGEAAFEDVAEPQPQTTYTTQPQTTYRTRTQTTYWTQPQTTYRTQPQTNYRTQSQTSIRSQSRASGRTFYYRQPAVCNT